MFEIKFSQNLKNLRSSYKMTQKQLANLLEVDQRTVSAWENEKKSISAKRSRQLSEFFGIDETFFGEINNEQKTYIIEKAMFKHDHHGKEIFKFKPEGGVDDISKVMVYFKGESEISLSDAYDAAKRIKENTVNRIDSFIHKNKGEHMESEIMRITNYTKIYGELSDLLESIDEQKHYLKVPYRFEIIDVLDAMRVAFGLLDEEKVKGYNKSECFVGMDSEYILELAAMIKNHWMQINDYHENLRKNSRKNKTENNNDKPLPSVEVQIEQMEEKQRQWRKNKKSELIADWH